MTTRWWHVPLGYWALWFGDADGELTERRRAILRLLYTLFLLAVLSLWLWLVISLVFA